MKLSRISLGILSAAILSLALTGPMANAMGRARGTNPEVVKTVDLDRYVGDWYEIAHAPNWFQRKCMSSLAHYEKLDATHVSVLNTCNTWRGRTKTISGYATVLDADTPAKLLVHFKIFGFIPVKGDYWIVDLGQDYEYAVVSSAGKKSLFILAREATLPKEKLDTILASLKERGFYVDNLVFDQFTDAETF